jgi:hypothetical protein
MTGEDSGDGDDSADAERARDDRPTNANTASDEAIGSSSSDTPEPRLVTRVLVTWIELTLVGLTGTLLGATVGGPPGFIVYLVTTLVTVGILFYNVNELIRRWVLSTAEAS